MKSVYVYMHSHSYSKLAVSFMYISEEHIDNKYIKLLSQSLNVRDVYKESIFKVKSILIDLCVMCIYLFSKPIIYFRWWEEKLCFF